MEQATRQRSLSALSITPLQLLKTNYTRHPHLSNKAVPAGVAGRAVMCADCWCWCCLLAATADPCLACCSSCCRCVVDGTAVIQAAAQWLQAP